MSETERIVPVMGEPESDEAAESTPAGEGNAKNNGASTESTLEADGSELETVRAERDQALKEKQELLDQFQRAQAEFENIRKRLQHEKEDVVRYAASETIHSLLPIVDDLERAIETEGIDPTLKEGLELIHRQIFEVFNRAGLRPVDQHDTFDPHLHNAVDRAPAEEDQDDQAILEVYQKTELGSEEH